MSENDFYTPTDIDALRMENELLAFEVRFLKARLAEQDHLATERKDQLIKARQSGRQLRAKLEEAKTSSLLSPQRKARLEQAEKDLVMLLERLSGSPLGPLLRTRKGFRDLEQRYLKP